MSPKRKPKFAVRPVDKTHGLTLNGACGGASFVIGPVDAGRSLFKVIAEKLPYDSLKNVERSMREQELRLYWRLCCARLHGNLSLHQEGADSLFALGSIGAITRWNCSTFRSTWCRTRATNERSRRSSFVRQSRYSSSTRRGSESPCYLAAFATTRRARFTFSGAAPWGKTPKVKQCRLTGGGTWRWARKHLATRNVSVRPP